MNKFRSRHILTLTIGQDPLCIGELSARRASRFLCPMLTSTFAAFLVKPSTALRKLLRTEVVGVTAKHCLHGIQSANVTVFEDKVAVDKKACAVSGTDLAIFTLKPTDFDLTELVLQPAPEDGVHFGELCPWLCFLVRADHSAALLQARC